MTSFNANGTVSDFTDRMGRTTIYAYSRADWREAGQTPRSGARRPLRPGGGRNVNCSANLNLSTVTPTGLSQVAYTHGDTR